MDLALQAINNNWNQIKLFTNIPKDDFIDAITFVLNSTYFTYKNQTFSQIYGAPMGSPLSSTIAELVLGDMEKTLLNNKPYITFYKRYVDDILICAHPNHTNTIFDLFNKYHPHLQYTIELENSNSSINFLDLTLTRHPSGIIITNWFRKKIKSTRYINFNSYTALKYKTSIITSLVDRAIILSHPKFHTPNLKYITKILLDNDYPINFINKQIKKRLNLKKNKTNFNNPNPNPT